MTDRARGDAGITFIEILFTVAIVGIAFATLLGGMWSAVVVSHRHRQMTTAEATLRAFAEAVKHPGTTYSPCATAYSPSGFVQPSGFPSPTASVTGYWNSTTRAFQSSCPTPQPDAQLVRLNIASNDGFTAQTLTVVKRRP